MGTLWQQVVALDARFNTYRAPESPQYRTLYMRRRSHLLKENAASVERDVSVRREYLKIRGQLLAERYGPPAISEQGSLYSRAASLSSAKFNRSKQGSDPSRTLKVSANSSRTFSATPSVTGVSSGVGLPHCLELRGIVPTAAAEASKAMAGKSLSENYAFSGMQHIFDQHRSAVVAIAFANDDKSRVACCSYDGTISVMQVIPTPSTVICTFKHHTSAVTDFMWSISNDNILSSSLDGTAILWEVSSARPLRIFGQPRGPEILCCRFQPLNNNLFAVGRGNSDVQIINVSTGKSPRGGTSHASGRVLSIDFSSSGRILWAADDRGYIFSFNLDPMTGKIHSKHKKLAVCLGHPITSIRSRTWINREASNPCLLANCGIGQLILFSVNSRDGSLTVKQTFPISQRGQLIRSNFCPLISFRQGACVVTGSEDMNVYFFDIERDNKQCVNKLQGHSGPVLDVCFNYDESLLASCDANGLVIIWKRNDKVLL